MRQKKELLISYRWNWCLGSGERPFSEHIYVWGFVLGSLPNNHSQDIISLVSALKIAYYVTLENPLRSCTAQFIHCLVCGTTWGAEESPVLSLYKHPNSYVEVKCLHQGIKGNPRHGSQPDPRWGSHWDMPRVGGSASKGLTEMPAFQTFPSLSEHISMNSTVPRDSHLFVLPWEQLWSVTHREFNGKALFSATHNTPPSAAYT